MNDLKRISQVRKVMATGQARTVLLAALVASLFAAVGVFHTSVRVSVVRSGYELGQAEARHRKLLRENERLKLERATLRSASRLEAIAKSRLGMTSPTASQIVALSHSQPIAFRTNHLPITMGSTSSTKEKPKEKPGNLMASVMLGKPSR